MITQFPGPFVFHAQANNHEKNKQELLPYILKEYIVSKSNPQYKWSKDTESNIVTNFANSNTNLFTDQHYDDIIWSCVTQFFDEIDQSNSFLKIAPTRPYNAIVDSLWWNVYQPGDFVDLHNHQLSGLSGVYFLDLPDDNSTTFVYDNQFPLTDSLPTWLIHHKADYVKEGDVILFPSKLNHYVSPVKNKKISISFNLYLNYQDIDITEVTQPYKLL